MQFQKRPAVVAGLGLIMAGLLALGISVNGGWGAAAPPPVAIPSGDPTGGALPSRSTAPSSTTTAASSPPLSLHGSQVWLEIPSLGIGKRLAPEGLVGGKINPPAGVAIWFTGYGRVKPGKLGTAVVAGHIVANGRPDIFYNLDKVRRGALVRVHDATGKVVTLKIVQTLTVDKTALQTNQTVWGGNSTVRRVALVTCDDALGLRPDGHRVANFVAIAEVA